MSSIVFWILELLGVAIPLTSGKNQTGSMPVVSAVIQSTSLSQGYTGSVTRLVQVMNTRMSAVAKKADDLLEAGSTPAG